MGAKVKKEKLYFVSFEPISKFRCFLSIEAIIKSEKELEPLLAKASKIYENAIAKMRSLIEDFEVARNNRKPIAARKMWEVGDAVFRLRKELEKLGFELDGVYDHLTRDLGVKRMWLEKVIIFRRYLSEKKVIPKSLNWSVCRLAPRSAAEKLKLGQPLN